MCKTILAIGKLTFDISIGEIFHPLLKQIKNVMTNENENNSVFQISDFINKYNVDLIQTTSTRISGLLASDIFRSSIKERSNILEG